MRFTFIGLLLIMYLLILTPSQMKCKNFSWVLGHSVHTALNPLVFLCAPIA